MKTQEEIEQSAARLICSSDVLRASSLHVKLAGLMVTEEATVGDGVMAMLGTCVVQLGKMGHSREDAHRVLACIMFGPAS